MSFACFASAVPMDKSWTPSRSAQLSGSRANTTATRAKRAMRDVAERGILGPTGFLEIS
eukprot:CAMPEP_0181486394 /NCGR_PEP_ID=MMETSP1110-20121109/47130_1 /TAXON_ID=174948 /ORGANISM="Symbiodinium sp., Strain CCMP421" /LENGTH=58 /DNA_ID=CAMNT_0023612567 /DNA_START=153 /DNA_END=325 /DNA_ORIENTATION=-